jgi:aminoglycoside phosphotransferase (APT) family kinase protein
VNIVLEPDGVVLLDWGLTTFAPPACELAMFLAGTAANCAGRRTGDLRRRLRVCRPSTARHDATGAAGARLPGQGGSAEGGARIGR